ncbi:MAG TPA: methyltransferase domain-containing protein [Terriglobales bacterium]|nr:methyltransferase domain-containing protein [Terriglobales bacterium]
MSKAKWLLPIVAGVAAGAFIARQYKKKALAEEADLLWSLLGLRPGARVGEVGAGTGSMTEQIAARLKTPGHLFATEIDDKRLRQLVKKKVQQDWRNVTVEASHAFDCRIPANSCDAIYMRAVYHHFTDPAQMNGSIFRALRPGGTLAVVDFTPRWWLAPCMPKGIPANRGGHGIPSAILAEELEQVGFEQVRSIANWPGRKFCLLFQKPIAS